MCVSVSTESERARGREGKGGERASGRAGERASGRAGERARGREGERARGRAGERASGREGEMVGAYRSEKVRQKCLQSMLCFRDVKREFVLFDACFEILGKREGDR